MSGNAHECPVCHQQTDDVTDACWDCAELLAGRGDLERDIVTMPAREPQKRILEALDLFWAAVVTDWR